MTDDPQNGDSIEQLNRRLDYFDELVHRQTARIYEIEKRLGISSPVARPVDQPVVETITAVVEPVKPVAGQEIPPVEVLSPRRSRRLRNVAAIDWESLIGGNWFNRIGILAIILATGLFLKYAIENEWVGPLGRVAIGMLLGTGLMIGGESMLRRGFRFFAHGLSGGGICILYLSVFAAYDRYRLIGQLVALAMMTLVTLVAVLFSARYNALAIAVLGLVGGFLTPILLSSGKDNQPALFGYMILLDLGVLAIAWFRHWRTLNYLAFAATLLLSFAWWEGWYDSNKLALTLILFTILFLIFAFAAILHHLVRREPSRELDLLLILLNGGIYFRAVYSLLGSNHHRWLGGYAVLMAIFYLGQGYVVQRRDGDDRYLKLILFGLAGVFLTLAIPIQFSLAWVTIGWVIEGLALTWIGLKTDRRLTRLAGIVLFVLAISHWWMLDLRHLSPEWPASFIPLFNRRGVPMFAIILSLLAAARLQFRPELPELSKVRSNERALWNGALILSASLLVIAWVTVDVWDWFRMLELGVFPPIGADSGLDPNTGLRVTPPQVRQIQSWKPFFFGGWWAFSGVGLLIAGLRRQAVVARLLGLLLLSFAGLDVMASASGYADDEWHSTLLNPTFGAFAVIAGCLALGYREYRQQESRIGQLERRIVVRLMLSFANIFMLTGLSFEVEGFFSRHPMSQNGVIRQLCQSMLFTAYGGTMIWAGIRRANRQLRILGLLTLGITTFKVFIFDLAALEQIYRVISFIVLGVILLVVSFLYQKRQKGQPAEQPAEQPPEQPPESPEVASGDSPGES